MPKSKRDKKISLTQTKKKGLELKQKLIEEIRSCTEKYVRVFTFSVHNMRNVQLKEVRNDWHSSRFFFGKNKVMSLALGRTAEDECKDNIHKLSSQLHGQTGLLFTNKPKKEVLDYFDGYRMPDYARSGNIATQTVHLEQGPMPEFSHSMEPQLRQLGLPTSLQRGTVTLLREHKVCEKDDVLTPEQARILKLFGHMMAEFHITVEGVWEKNKWKVLAERPVPIVPPKVTVRPKKKSDDDDDEAAMEDLEEGDDKIESDEET
ncbi:mRNA turnover protein 4 homolog [Mizuhopecten yessoensis]|uniref:Ribosome assembly factor mrt4 n=1 Tax=Mizuhopecten yessoensis TaxID=6573 RepID=A0A210Q7G0_MIZYE|nr:mRNA turnover protein 4 homolog [Mizuhopecten yessoensis]OWF44670.1 mRNA turnover protein 4-like [Mizuhopecten yessoensis]